MLTADQVSILSDVAFAKEELNRYLTMITGKAPGKHGFPIRVSVTGEGGEGYHVTVSLTGVSIEGGSVRGAVYGMYAFLEKCLHCQFLSEDCEIIPKADCLRLEEISFASKPAFDYREVYWRGALSGRFALQMRLNSARAEIPPDWGGRVMFYNYSHTFEELVPPDEFFDTHPEYFSMVDGKRQREKSQLCLTNENVKHIVISRVLDWMRAHRDCTIFSVAMNDWYSPCQCPACAALDASEESHAGTMIAFVNTVADAVLPEFPHNFIHTFAYLYCRKPPRTLRPRPNVIVRLCSIECCFSHPMAKCDAAVNHIDVETTTAQAFSPAERLFLQDLKEWSHICNMLYIWDYTTNFSNYLQPFPNLHVLAPNLQLMRAHSVKGVFEQGNYSPGKASAFGALKIYLLSRLLWNPDEDTQMLISCFVRGYYGEPAVGMLLEFLDLSKAAVCDHHMSLFDGVQAPYLTESFVREGGRLFAAALAVTDDIVHRERIEREALSLRYVFLASLPLSHSGRDALIDAFAEDVKKLGISELFERRELSASFEAMKVSRWARDRKSVPYAVYRL